MADNYGVNKKESNSVATKNINKIDDMVVAEVEKTLRELDDDIEELDSYMNIMKDRMMGAETEVSYPITLARFAELKLATRKQKNEALKTLISYKAEERQHKKRSSDGASAIADIMAGVGLGVALGNTNKLDISGGTSNTPKEVDVELNPIMDVEEVDVDNIDDAVLNMLKIDGESDGN